MQDQNYIYLLKRYPPWEYQPHFEHAAPTFGESEENFKRIPSIGSSA